MVPFYFGSSELPLFGLYHPATSAASGRGVVIVNPMGPEYLPAYPVLRALAIRLAQTGLHVLRFDLSGTGDSGGDSGEGSVERWVDEVQLAADELEAMASVQRVSAIGLRLGASLAALAEQRAPRFSQLVLWEPVLDGARYLGELRDLQAKYIRETVPKPRAAARLGPAHEVVGYPMAAELVGSLGRLGLEEGVSTRAECLTLSREPPAGLCHGAGCRHVPYNGPTVWLKDVTVEEPPVPTATIDEIVGYVSKE